MPLEKPIMMNKHFLIRKVACVHAIKCNKTTSYQEALKSNSHLSELNSKIDEAPNDGLYSIDQEIELWAGQNPVATGSEIDYLMKNRK